jgi:hypothetical protein
MKTRPAIRILATAAVLAASVIALVTVLRQRNEIEVLQARLAARQNEMASLQATLATRPTNRLATRTTRATIPDSIPPARNPQAFAGIAESSIPGRYEWTQAGEAKGVIILFPDHTFENHKGEKFAAYQWNLFPDRLVLDWNLGSIHYLSVESPGVYVGVRTDGQSERMEKLKGE